MSGVVAVSYDVTCLVYGLLLGVFIHTDVQLFVQAILPNIYHTCMVSHPCMKSYGTSETWHVKC